MYWLYAILGAVAVIVLTVAVRTMKFVPKSIETCSHGNVAVNVDKAVSDLSKMVQCKTVSDRNKSNEAEDEFDKFKSLLTELFPAIHKKCTFEAVGDRALLYKLDGKSSASPTVLMSHFDVVSVDESGWEKDPFGGEIENGVLKVKKYEKDVLSGRN